jgi:hypothetical protein
MKPPRRADVQAPLQPDFHQAERVLVPKKAAEMLAQ